MVGGIHQPAFSRHPPTMGMPLFLTGEQADGEPAGTY
jgi:hypothetical protein